MGRRLQRRDEGWLCAEGCARDWSVSVLQCRAQLFREARLSEGGERVKQREGPEGEGKMFRAGVWKVLLQEAWERRGREESGLPPATGRDVGALRS